MRIGISIDYWADEVLTFDPEKILFKLKKYFPQVEIDKTDYSRKEVERVTKFANENISEPDRSKMINQVHGKNRANGPAFLFKIPINENIQINGRVQRYSISFKSEEDFNLETEKTIIDFLKSLKYGKIESDTKTENFINSDKDSKKCWLLEEST